MVRLWVGGVMQTHPDLSIFLSFLQSLIIRQPGARFKIVIIVQIGTQMTQIEQMPADFFRD